MPDRFASLQAETAFFGPAQRPALLLLLLLLLLVVKLLLRGEALFLWRDGRRDAQKFLMPRRSRSG